MSVNLGFDQQQLAQLIDHVKNEPEAGKTVWSATTNWQKGFQSQATIRSHTVPMDEPKLMGGSDTAPNMVEMVLGAYGCCLTTGFVANAAMRGIELEGVDISLDGDLDLRSFFGLKSPEEVSPGYTEVRAKISLKAPGATPEQLQELYDAVVPTSPVGSIITRPVNVVTELA